MTETNNDQSCPLPDMYTMMRAVPFESAPFHHRTDSADALCSRHSPLSRAWREHGWRAERTRYGPLSQHRANWRPLKCAKFWTLPFWTLPTRPSQPRLLHDVEMNAYSRTKKTNPASSEAGLVSSLRAALRRTRDFSCAPMTNYERVDRDVAPNP